MQDGWEQAKIRARAAVRRTATGTTAERVEKAKDDARKREQEGLPGAPAVQDFPPFPLVAAQHFRKASSTDREKSLSSSGVTMVTRENSAPASVTG